MSSLGLALADMSRVAVHELEEEIFARGPGQGETRRGKRLRLELEVAEVRREGLEGVLPRVFAGECLQGLRSLPVSS